jgi:hypothetical protein
MKRCRRANKSAKTKGSPHDKYITVLLGYSSSCLSSNVLNLSVLGRIAEPLHQVFLLSRQSLASVACNDPRSRKMTP